MSSEKQNPKSEEIRLRRMQVERLHIRGLSVHEIAQEVGVDERTVSRDIQENRRERLHMVVYGNGKTSRANDAREWLRNELADYIAFMESAKREFQEQSHSFKNEAARSRALWHAVEISMHKVETIKSLMLAYGEITMGGLMIDENYDLYESYGKPPID